MSLEVINKAREQITEESLEIKSALATFIEETINERCTTKGVANKILLNHRSYGWNSSTVFHRNEEDGYSK